MEKIGTIRMFERSLINGLRYTNMVCDGDASAFEAIKYHYVERHQQQRAYLTAHTTISMDGDGDVEEEQEGDDNFEEEEPEESGDILNNLIVIKEDCVNHISKRVMKYLLEVKREKTRKIMVSKETAEPYTTSASNKQLSKQLLGDNKRWGGGPGRMTDNMMKKLSNSYGLAIRQASSLTSDKKCDK
jgi:hypothetical protein